MTNAIFRQLCRSDVRKSSAFLIRPEAGIFSHGCCWVLCLTILLLNLATAFAQTAPAPPIKTGQISGRVLDDGGEPVAAAVIRITYVGVKPRGLQPNATTDSEGRFVFESLSPGNYRFLVSERGLIIPEFIGTQPTYKIGEQVTLNLVKGGVITGRVTSATDEPLVGIEVIATRLRDANGNVASGTYSRFTDDRGVYRVYGLPPGVYLVNAGKQSISNFEPTAFDGEAPMFHPASTRDTASEITVALGAEIGGIDIRHRGEFGRLVSGRIVGATTSVGSNGSFAVEMRTPNTQQIIATVSVYADAARRGFHFAGVLDGEYELVARRGDGADGGAASAPRRVIVKGADLTDIELTLAPLASLSGRVAVEPATADPNKCANTRAMDIQEVLINAPRQDKADLYGPSNAAPNAAREFRVTGLEAGRYALAAQLPSEAWYVKSIAQETPSANKRAPATLAPLRAALALTAGQNQTCFVFTLAEGAAQMGGQLAVAAKRKQPVTVHLIPAETTAADDVWRYDEMTLRDESAFSFKHLAPGKYWLLPLPREEKQISPLAFDVAQRAKLRQRASGEGQEITLAPCQRVTQLLLR